MMLSARSQKMFLRRQRATRISLRNASSQNLHRLIFAAFTQWFPPSLGA
jgi:hypothetical protein